MFFSIKGLFATYSFHSSSSILPSPFASASTNVCLKRASKQVGELEKTEYLLSYTLHRGRSLPCPQSFLQHHQIDLAQIHSKGPTPFLSTVNMPKYMLSKRT